MAHPARASALIVGGGDGCSADELLKYPTMKTVTLVEIDLAVVDIARKYFGEIHRGALNDPRLRLIVEDGLAFAH
jgi:spermidine synthase